MCRNKAYNKNLFSNFCHIYSFLFGNLTFFWRNDPHIANKFEVKRATDLEQETWVMPDPRYIAHTSIFLEI